MVDTHHIAWAAGFFDGEGSIGAVLDRRHGGSFTVNMCVVQAGTKTEPPDTLVRFLEIAGVGHLEKRNENNRGRLGKKPLWVWRVSNINDVRSFSRRLFPYLGQAKTDQIAKALAVRAESEGLTTDRRLFCKQGHPREHRGDSAKTFRCWECHNTYSRAFKRRRRLAVVAASGKGV